MSVDGSVLLLGCDELHAEDEFAEFGHVAQDEKRLEIIGYGCIHDVDSRADTAS